MSLKIHIAVASLVFAVLQTPAFAAPMPVDTVPAVSAELQSCYNEARWPVLSQPSYIDGAERVREQKRNGFNRSVFVMNALCHQMADATADKTALANDCGSRISDMLKAYGSKAKTHALRTRDICQAMTGQTVTVEGI